MRLTKNGKLRWWYCIIFNTFFIVTSIIVWVDTINPIFIYYVIRVSAILASLLELLYTLVWTISGEKK